MKPPTPAFQTIAEYEAAAQLLGMIYDSDDHTFYSDSADYYTSSICPDTMKSVGYPGDDCRGYYIWKDLVRRRIIGPKEK